MLKLLNHKNIVTYLGTLYKDNVMNIFMEYDILPAISFELLFFFLIN